MHVKRANRRASSGLRIWDTRLIGVGSPSTYQIPKTKSSAHPELSELLGKVRKQYQGTQTVIPVLPTTS